MDGCNNAKAAAQYGKRELFSRGYISCTELEMDKRGSNLK